MASSDRTQRFSRLQPAGREEAAAGDLFAHFGVVSEPVTEPVAQLGQPTAALACADCGWFRATPLVEPCPLCAAKPRSETSDAGNPEAK